MGYFPFPLSSSPRAVLMFCAGVHIRTGSNGRVAREQSEAISVWDDSPCGAAVSGGGAGGGWVDGGM